MLEIRVSPACQAIQLNNPVISLLELYSDYEEAQDNRDEDIDMMSFTEWLEQDLIGWLADQDIYYTNPYDVVFYWGASECDTVLLDKLHGTSNTRNFTITNIASMLDLKTLEMLYNFQQDFFDAGRDVKDFESSAELFLLYYYNIGLLSSEWNYSSFQNLYPFEVVCNKQGDIEEHELINWARNKFSDTIDYEAVFRQHDGWAEYALERLYDYDIVRSVRNPYTCWICDKDMENRY